MPYSRPQPFDKTIVTREWRHIIPGALTLAFVAGYINSVVLGFFATPVSHMTGAVSYFSIDIVMQDQAGIKGSLIIIFGFILGAIISGLAIGAEKLLPARRFGSVMVMEGIILAAATLLLLEKSIWGAGLAAVACGMQNAMTSSYLGLAIRTTHVTGTITDIGVMIGHYLRHGYIEGWKFRFLLALACAFGMGCIIGSFFNLWYGPICLLFAAIGISVSGLLFYIAMQVLRRRGINFLEADFSL